MEKKIRCPWATTPIYQDYHDYEWGRAVYDDKKLFEMLILEGMQAGLSWLIILNKREFLRSAFDRFEAKIIATYDMKKVEELMQNEKIICNRLKINAVINNAKHFLEVQENYGSFSHFIWSYVNNKPSFIGFKNLADVPKKTQLSTQISDDLKKIGFKFVGPTIIYSFMQAVGIVNDHLLSCHVHKEILGGY